MHGSASVAHSCDGNRSASAVRQAGAARLATSWAVAFALLFQIVAMAVSPVAPAGSLDSLIGAAICHSADEGTGSGEPQDRLVVHFKCIACVLACSAPPPSIDAAAAVQFAWARYRPGWPLAAVLSEGASTSSHFARGPPATA
jgi:hypothetical protein